MIHASRPTNFSITMNLKFPENLTFPLYSYPTADESWRSLWTPNFPPKPFLKSIKRDTRFEARKRTWNKILEDIKKHFQRTNETSMLQEKETGKAMQKAHYHTKLRLMWHRFFLWVPTKSWLILPISLNTKFTTKTFCSIWKISKGTSNA